MMNASVDYELSQAFERWQGGDLVLWQERVRSKLLELTHCHETPQGGFSVLESRVREVEGVRQQRHMVEPTPWDAQPIYELEPLHGGNGVTLIAFHGHGTDPFDNIYVYIRELARRGYRIILPILFGTMERDVRNHSYLAEYDPRGLCAYWLLEANALGTTLLGARLFDAMLAYRFAKTLPGVDPERIGSIGLSMGGELALYLPAIEPGIRCAVSAGFFSSFKSLLLEKRNCHCYSIIGWPQNFDMPDIAGCVAPRPLQIQKGNRDGCFDHDDVGRAFTRLKSIYERFGAPDRVEYAVYPGEHILNADRAEEWLRQHIPHDNQVVD